MTRLDAVLFDMDGTLVETESLWHDAENATMAEFGQNWSDAEQLMALGGPFDKVARYMAEKASVPVSTISESLMANIHRLMRESPLPLQPGVRELHDEIVAAGLPVGLVTNSFRNLVELVLAATELRFDVIVTGDEVEHNKPHPAPYLAACAALGVVPTNVVVLEDSATGVASAIEAGCYVFGISHHGPIAAGPNVTEVAGLTGLRLTDLSEHLSRARP